nr:MAG TPA: hypothetical protein [Bacteriophage sp.]
MTRLKIMYEEKYKKLCKIRKEKSNNCRISIGYVKYCQNSSLKDTVSSHKHLQTGWFIIKY